MGKPAMKRAKAGASSTGLSKCVCVGGLVWLCPVVGGCVPCLGPGFVIWAVLYEFVGFSYRIICFYVAATPPPMMDVRIHAWVEVCVCAVPYEAG